MLQTINDKAKGIIGWVIIALISVTFALFGISDYIGNDSAPFAAKVNDTEISIRSYQEALSRQRERLTSMFGGNLPSDAAFENTIKKQVLDQLISRAVLDERTAEAGYRVNNQMASNKIKAMEAFQQNGKFASATYKQIVNSKGMSVAQFETIFRGDMVVQQLQNSITQSSIVGNAAIQKLNSLQQQTRDVSYIELENSKYTSGIKLSEEEVQQYYAENGARYMHPEQVSISYVEINADDISSNIEIDEESIRRQYDTYVASIADSEQRKAKHILVQFDSGSDDVKKAEAQNKINDALTKLKSGSSFDELAKTISEDPGSASKGGDIGWVSRGMMGTAFDNALFKLEKGKTSEVVQSSFGFHIIKLTDTKGASPESYEIKKAELIKELKQQDIEKIFYERSELMATLAYENDDSLEPVADSLQLKIKTSKLFTRTSGLELASNEDVRGAAFNPSVLTEGRNSDVVELDKNHIVVLRIDQHINSKPKSLDEIRPVLEMALKNIMAKEKVQADGLQLLADLQQGESMQQAAQSQQLNLKKLEKIKRDDASAKQAIVREAFRMSKPEAGKSQFKIIDLPTGVAVVAVNSVEEPDAEVKVETIQSIASDLERSLSNQEITAVIDFLKSQSDIIESKNL